MAEISLTSSMRNNLLSLQQTAKLQDLTQNRLATGLKVNSAIDNPSSYYTAQSLSNRAEDLNVLLDAMSQGIQTLKAVNESIETGTKFLEQAKSVANSALETAPKLYTGPIAAKVSTEAELLDAINNTTAADGVIVITNNIALSENVGLVLKDGQKLVGQNYIDGKGGQAQLSFNFTHTLSSVGIELADNSLISDLKINYKTAVKVNNTDFFALRNSGHSNVRLNNLTMNIRSDSTHDSFTGAIFNMDNSDLTLSGEITINAPTTTGTWNVGILNNSASSRIVQTQDSILNINTASKYGYGIVLGTNSFNGQVNIKTTGEASLAIGDSHTTINGNINLSTSGNNSSGFINSDVILTNNALVNITTNGTGSHGVNSGSMTLKDNSRLNVWSHGNNSYGFYATKLITDGNSQLNILADGAGGRGISTNSTEMRGNSVINMQVTEAGFSDNNFMMTDSAVMNIKSLNYGIFSSSNINMLSNKNQINIDAPISFMIYAGSLGTKIQSVAGSQIHTNEGLFIAPITITSPTMTPSGSSPAGFDKINSDPAKLNSDFTSTFADFSKYILNSQEAWKLPATDAETTSKYSAQYNQILSQYDMLINDSFYKGVNLLKQQDLKVVFNESRSSDLEIKGVDATSKGLGLKDAAWNNGNEVQVSINQLDEAINQLRLFASEFGNYYQIVTTREDFTNSLINVLTEGADALTLADMNQESANMLALQTRQQLAVNSLSLASQASQSVLKLF